MSAEPEAQPEAEPTPRRTQFFRKSGGRPRPSPDEARRQNEVVQFAWKTLRDSGTVIAFLNTPHAELDAQPLRLALDSDAGLERVKRLLEGMGPGRSDAPSPPQRSATP